MAMGGAALLLLLGSSSYYWRSHRAGSASSAGETAAADSAGSIGSVAVIPFVNTGGSAQDEYFSDGMTDELAHALSRLPQLRVAGRSSSYAFKGKNASAQDVGRALNVAAVVEGSIRRAGDRLRVIAQLTNTSNGSVIWSDSYESKARDVFQVQDEFTKAIVGALTPALAGKTAATVASSGRGTTSEEAYDLYLKGRYYFLKRGGANLTKAIDFYNRALSLDPKFARAHAGIAMIYSVLPSYTAQVSWDSATKVGLASAQAAVADDSTLGDAHLALANVLNGMTRLPESETEFQKALSLQPNDATTHEWHGDNLGMMGRIKDALTEEKRAAELDPLSAIVATEIQYVLYVNGQFDESIRQGTRARQIDPTLSITELNLAPAYIFAGRPDSAIAALERVRAREPNLGEILGPLTLAYAAAGRWEDAARLKRETEQAGNSEVNDFDRLDARLAFSDWDGALQSFLRLTAVGVGGVYFGCDPLFDPLKRFPQFNARLSQYSAKTCPATIPWPVKPPPPQYAVKQ
jgi:serine/threonine-protein kinase